MMRVYVNDTPMEVVPGMTVRHALMRAGLWGEAGEGKKVYDEWHNEVGLEGALSEGMRISTGEAPSANKARKGDCPE